MPTLAAILVIVAYNMGEWEEFFELKKAPKSDALVFLVTFFLTVFIDLVVAIEIGMVLAAFLFMKRMSDVTNIKFITAEDEEEDFIEMDGAILPYKKALLDKILIYEINGPFFFAAADKFLEITAQMNDNFKVLVLRMGKVPAMDATAFHALEIIQEMCKHRKMSLIFSKVQEQPMKMMEKYGFVEKIGTDNFCDNIDFAMDKAAEYIK
jgi:SulP family sulfate permease